MAVQPLALLRRLGDGEPSRAAQDPQRFFNGQPAIDQ
jgi:hypothetical protein